MFDRLFDFLAAFWSEIWPIYLVREYQAGVQLRLGRYLRTVGPGWYWAWPFLETAIIEDVVTSTANLHAQSLTTRDSVSIVLQAVLTSHVCDVRKLLLECENREGVLVDASMGILGAMVAERTWAEVSSPQFVIDAYKRIHRRALKYGVELEAIQLSDLAKARSIRLWPAN